MRVQHVGTPSADKCPDPPRRAEVPVGTHRNRRRRDAAIVQLVNERRPGRTDHQRLETTLAESAREQHDLSLTASPVAPGIEMKNPQRHMGEDNRTQRSRQTSLARAWSLRYLTQQ